MDGRISAAMWLFGGTNQITKYEAFSIHITTKHHGRSRKRLSSYVFINFSVATLIASMSQLIRLQHYQMDHLQFFHENDVSSALVDDCGWDWCRWDNRAVGPTNNDRMVLSGILNVAFHAHKKFTQDMGRYPSWIWLSRRPNSNDLPFGNKRGKRDIWFYVTIN